MPYSSAGGVRIYYETAGAGPPFLFIHANPLDHAMWLYQTAHFADRFRTIAVDLRAYGRSDKPTAPYPFADLAADIAGVCAREGVRDAIVAGASIGAKIAFELALARPELVAALVLVGGNAFRGTTYDARIRGYREQGVGAYRPRHMAELVAPAFRNGALGRYLLDCFLESSPALSGEAIARLFEAFDGVDLAARVPALRLPVLIVNGAHDASLAGARRTAAAIPGAVHRVIAGAGHLCCLEDPAAFDALVEAFLADNGVLPVGRARPERDQAR